MRLKPSLLALLAVGATNCFCRRRAEARRVIQPMRRPACCGARDPGQIAGLSPYAADRSLSVVADKARAFPRLDWQAEIDHRVGA